LPKICVYFFLMSFTCGIIAAGSSGSSLICESGVRSAGSFTSACTERCPPTSTRSCWIFGEYTKFSNTRAALGWGAFAKSAIGDEMNGVPSTA